MSKRMLILMCSILLIVPLLFMGCGSDGSDGSNGTNGINGTNGTNGQVLTAALAPESCAICHNDQTIRDGDAHQADYDQRFQDQVVTVSGLAYTFNAADNSHNVSFTLLRNGVSFPCTDVKTGAPADSLSIAYAEYNPATRTFNAPLPLNQLTSSGLALGSQATLVNGAE